ncbi:MAG: twin-arginine translocase subunit TatC [Bacteroidota bacterium]
MTEKIGNGEEKEMSFVDHLEELRWHLIRGLIAVMVVTIAAFAMNEWLFNYVILAPGQADFWTFKKLCELSAILNSDALCIEEIEYIIQSRKLTGQFTMSITSSFVTGLIVAFPYFFWEVWRFISPGLYSNEKKVSRGAVFFVSFLFLTGVAFGYFIMSPLAINFLANYKVSETVANEFDITSYVGTLITLVFGSGILFQLPIVVYFLSKVGLVTPQLMRKYRKHAVVVILILGAMLTPPDPFSQVLIALPLFLLYQISISISALVIRKARKRELKLAKQTQ